MTFGIVPEDNGEVEYGFKEALEEIEMLLAHQETDHLAMEAMEKKLKLYKKLLESSAELVVMLMANGEHYRDTPRDPDTGKEIPGKLGCIGRCRRDILAIRKAEENG